MAIGFDPTQIQTLERWVGRFQIKLFRPVWQEREDADAVHLGKTQREIC